MIKKIKVKKLFLSLLLLMIMAVSITTMAATSKQGAGQTLIDNVVGRYRLSYIGNTNHYASWNTNGTYYYGQNYVYDDVGGWGNSSTAKLDASSATSKIKYAYLVWETRAPEGATAPIAFFTPKGGQWILPTYAVNDWRDSGNGSWAYSTMYCMATDVTDIVRAAGYGEYSVCNIPRWDANNYKDGNGVTPGGESPGSWQLVIVEENDDFPVSAVSLRMGADFRMAQNYNTSLSLVKNGLKSKASGMATGQIFFGASNSSSNAPMTENVTTYDSGGTVIKPVVSNTTYKAGLYRNGNSMQSNDMINNGCIRMSLSDVNDIGNRAQRIDMQVENTGWTTFFFLGLTVDIAFPDFTADQQTTVNSSTSVTVSGSIKNSSASPDTGIYDGKLIVTLDDALTPISTTAVINGVNTISGRVEGNAVVFDGDAVRSMMPGETISYIIECTTANSGKTRFDNSDQFSGKLRSDGVYTGYHVDKVWSSQSYGIPKYSLTLNAGTGIESVAGAGEYTYGTTVKPTVVIKPGYHWSSWTGSYNISQQDFTFNMPSENISLTANAEANAYTIAFDANGGTGHIDNITAQYDTDISLPDGTGNFQKYTLDGVNVTEDVLSGVLKLSEQEKLETIEVSEESEELEEPEELEDTEESGEPEAVAASQQDMESAETAMQLDQAPKVYPSVFMGWSLEDGKGSFIPRWKAGDMVRNLTEENNATITLYAVWDDCPWIQAGDLYYTLKQAQSGFITQAEILSHATASDREDGSPIEPGFHEDGTSFSIPDYQESDFTQFQQEGSVTENLTVVDSVGSVYKKQITVHIVDTTAVAVKPVGTTRFINEYYYNQPYENGGFEDNSIWKTEPEYKEKIGRAFKNLENDTPIKSYTFTHEDVLEMKKFVERNGIGNSQSEDALSRFYEQFMRNN